MQRTIWWAAFLIFSLVSICFWGVSVLWDRSNVLERARAQLDTTAGLLDQHADRAFDAGDKVVQGLVELVGGRDLSNEDEARRTFEGMNRLIVGSPQISSAWIVDSKGRVVLENSEFPAQTPGSFRERPYFRIHEQQRVGLHIGPMAAGGKTGRPRFTMSRRIERSDGTFAGVAVAAVYSDYFSSVFQSAGLGPQARLTLSTANGERLAVWPPQAERASAPSDIIESQRMLSGYPAQIRLAQPTGALLKDWQRRSILSGAAIAALIATFGGLTAMGLGATGREIAARNELEKVNADLEARVEARTAEVVSAQEKLAESEGWLKLATEGAGVGTWEVDFSTHQGRWSPRGAAQMSAASETFTSADWTKVVHPNDRLATISAWEHAQIPGSYYDVRFRTATPADDGGERWIHARGRIEFDATDKPVRGAGVMVDITAQMRTEAALASSYAEMQALYETAPVGLCMLDRKMRFTRVNHRLAEINGFPVEAHLGRTVRELVPDIADVAEDLFRRIVETGEPVLDFEIVGQTPAQPGVTRYWSESWVPVFGLTGEVIGINIVAEETTARKQAEAEREVLINELNHRVKNTLATVQSLAMQSFRGDVDPAAARQAFESRLIALSAAHDVLTRENWEGADLHEIAQATTAPHRRTGAAAFDIAGPPVRLAPRMALSLAMTLHELCTNAAKYGALASPTGRISLQWMVNEADPQRVLLMQWSERGGPTVAPPTRIGFGSRLIKRQLSQELGGSVDLSYDPAGVICRISLPLATDPPEELRLAGTG